MGIASFPFLKKLLNFKVSNPKPVSKHLNFQTLKPIRNTSKILNLQNFSNFQTLKPFRNTSMFKFFKLSKF